MQSSRHQILFAVLLAGFVALFYFGRRAPELISASEQIPYTTLQMRTLDGTTFNPADLSDRVVLLHFWAYWCYPCIRELASLQQLADAMPEIKIVPVHLGFSGEALKFKDQLWSEKKLQLVTFFDEQPDTRKNFKIDALPASFIYDGRGHLVYRVHEEIDWSRPAVRDQLQKILE